MLGRLPLLASVLIAFVPEAAGSCGEAWPGFLGIGATSQTVESLPLHWSPGEGIAWRADLTGYGQSTPVVWNKFVFVTSVEGDNKEKLHVAAFDLDNGQQRWRQSFDSSSPVANSVYVSRAAPTPAVDSNCIYAFFESGDVAALDHSGKVLWQRTLLEDTGKLDAEFGLAASLAQDEASIFVLAEHKGRSFVFALDKHTGETRWRSERAPGISWSSPILMTIDGVPQIVISSLGGVTAYSPDDGVKLWSIDGLGGNTVASPLLAAENIILIGASPGREGRDADSARDSNLAIEVRREEGAWRPRMRWRLRGPMASFASPLAHGGYAYWINRAGAISCIEVATGELLYTERLEEACWATPLAIGDRLYCFGKDGATTVIAGGPEFRKLAVNRLWDPADAAPDRAAAERESTAERRAAAANFSGPIQYGAAAVDHRFLVRTGNRLYCIALGEK